MTEGRFSCHVFCRGTLSRRTKPHKAPNY